MSSMSKLRRKVCRKKAIDRVRRVLEALWEALEIRQGVPPEVSDVLLPRKEGKGKLITIRPSREGCEVVELDEPWKKAYLTSHRPVFPKVYLTGYETGRVVVEFGNFSLSQERVVFSCYSPNWAREKLKDLRIFRPLLRAFGIEDLEEALEILLTLENGEFRRVGPYLLVKTLILATLHKGELFGDLALDAKFLMGERVVFRYPSGVEVAFKPFGTFVQGWPVFKGLSIIWEEDEFFYNGNGFPYWKDIPDGEIVNKMFSYALRAGAMRRSSPRMEALIEELKKRRSPLRALREPRFLQEVCLRALYTLKKE